MEEFNYYSDWEKLLRDVNKIPRNNTKPTTFTCICKTCRKEFSLINRSKDKALKWVISRHEILCDECRREEIRKENSERIHQCWESPSYRNKMTEERSERWSSFHENTQKQETEEIKHLIYTPIDFLKWEKEKHRACTLICKSCGKEIPVRGKSSTTRFLRRLKKGEDIFLCKGCGISKTKKANNFERIKVSSKLFKCSFVKGQNYDGADFETRKKERKTYRFRCNNCGKIFESCLPFGDESAIACKECYPINTSSSQHEIEIYEFLRSIYPGKILLHDRELLSPYELDIYIPDKNLAIEVDGTYWHNDSLKTFMKYEEASKLGVRVIGIYDYEWRLQNNLIKNYLKAQLDLFDNKIGARECKLKEVSYKEAEEFIKRNHLQGSNKGVTNKNMVCLGLYYQNTLVQLETFDRPRFSKKVKWELVRECSLQGWRIYGGKSRLLSYFLKNYEGALISYCDKRFFSGTSYKKEGFKKEKDSPPSYRYFKNNKIYSRYSCMKSKLKNLLEKFNPDQSESENMKNNGFFKLYDFGNFVFTMRT
jgi:hypothetical protein